MKRSVYILLPAVLFSIYTLAQVQPGLQVEENKTVLFGADTLGAGVKLFWMPSKAAFRVGAVGVVNVQGQAFGNNIPNWDVDSIGLFSFATGYSTKAFSIYSTALGLGSEANGDVSTAFGSNTKANGTASTAMGALTIANGTLSTALGNQTQSNGYAALALGTYNDPVDTIQTGITDTTRLFIVGNGDFNNLSNAMVVQKNGRVGIGENSPAEPLEVNGAVRLGRGNVTNGLGRTLKIQGARSGSGMDFALIDFRNIDDDNGNSEYIGARISSRNDNSTDDGDLRFYTSAGSLVRRMIIESGGNVGFGNIDPVHPLEMASGAHVTAGGTWTNGSSRIYKENIQDLPLKDAMNTLAKLKPKQFNYKLEPNEIYLGFIAEEVPDLVATSDRKGLSPMDIVAVLTKVVQEQQERIELLERQVAKLTQP